MAASYWRLEVINVNAGQSATQASPLCKPVQARQLRGSEPVQPNVALHCAWQLTQVLLGLTDKPSSAHEATHAAPLTKLRQL